MGGGMGLILRKAFQSRLCSEYVKQNDWKMVAAYIDAIFGYHYFLEFLTKKNDGVEFCGRSSVGRAPPCQGGCRGFESLRPLHYFSCSKTPDLHARIFSKLEHSTLCTSNPAPRKIGISGRISKGFKLVSAINSALPIHTR